MSDDVSNSTTAHRAYIELKDECECRYWRQRLGARPRELKRAIRQVGNKVEDVERFLEHFGRTDPNAASHWRAISGL